MSFMTQNVPNQSLEEFLADIESTPSSTASPTPVFNPSNNSNNLIDLDGFVAESAGVLQPNTKPAQTPQIQSGSQSVFNLSSSSSTSSPVPSNPPKSKPADLDSFYNSNQPQSVPQPHSRGYAPPTTAAQPSATRSAGFAPGPSHSSYSNSPLPHNTSPQRPPTSVSSSGFGSEGSPKPEENRVVGFFKNLFSGQDNKLRGEVPETIVFTKFTVNAKDVKAILLKWISERWFLPGRILQTISVDQPVQELVPFWVFSCSTMTTAVAKCAFNSHVNDNGRNKVIETWKDGRCMYQNSFNEIALLAFGGVDEYRDLLLDLSDWNVDAPTQSVPSKAIPASVVAHPTLPWSELWAEHSEKVIKKQLVVQAKRELLTVTRANRIKDVKTIVTFTALKKRLLYLPVYSCYYFYESKRYHFLVHGQTGKVSGKRPYGLGALGVAVEDGVRDLFKKKNEPVPTSSAPPATVSLGGGVDHSVNAPPQYSHQNMHPGQSRHPQPPPGAYTGMPHPTPQQAQYFPQHAPQAAYPPSTAYPPPRQAHPQPSAAGGIPPELLSASSCTPYPAPQAPPSNYVPQGRSGFGGGGSTGFGGGGVRRYT